jgi:hypothetical protein
LSDRSARRTLPAGPKRASDGGIRWDGIFGPALLGAYSYSCCAWAGRLLLLHPHSPMASWSADCRTARPSKETSRCPIRTRHAIPPSSTAAGTASFCVFRQRERRGNWRKLSHGVRPEPWYLGWKGDRRSDRHRQESFAFTPPATSGPIERYASTPATTPGIPSTPPASLLSRKRVGLCLCTYRRSIAAA